MLSWFTCGYTGARKSPSVRITVHRCDMPGLPCVFNDTVPESMTVAELKGRMAEDVALQGVALACPDADVVICTAAGAVVAGHITLASVFPQPVASPKEDRSLRALPAKGHFSSTSDGLSDTGHSVADFEESSHTPTQSVDSLDTPPDHVLYMTVNPTHHLSCGMTTPEALAAAHKLSTGGLLHFSDLRAIHYALYFDDGRNPVYPIHTHRADVAQFFTMICKYVVGAYRGTPLAALWWQDFRDGDVVFYDLQGRENLGDYVPDTVIAGWTYFIQKAYDQHSHSGILMLPQPKDVSQFPSVFHGLSTKVRSVRHPLCAVYMISRRLSFARVFNGFDLLEEGVQRYVQEVFAAALRETAARDFGNTAPNLWVGIGKLVTARQHNLQPNQALSMTVSPVPSPRCSPRPPSPLVMDRTPSPVNPSDGRHLSPANVPAFCSGFTASVLFLCFQRVEQIVVERYPHLAACFQLQPHVRTDAFNYTPRDLHRWAIWDDAPVQPMAFEKYLHPDVNASRRLHAY